MGLMWQSGLTHFKRPDYLVALVAFVAVIICAEGAPSAIAKEEEPTR